MYEQRHRPSLPRHFGVPADEPILVLGETSFRNRRDRFGLLPTDRLRHTWIIGKTGSGKSTLLANLVAQDLARGTGLALLDPHGDLVETVLPFVPPHRVNDVVLFAPEDKEYPVSFNIFREGRKLHHDPNLLTSQLVSIFKKQWSNSWGPRLEHVLRNAILAVATDPKATLVYVYRFLTDETLRDKVVEQVRDPVVRTFWQKEFAGYKSALQAEAIAPVLNKLGAFVSNPVTRNIVGQERSRIDLHHMMQSRGILLANLATGKVGEDASRLFGGMLLSAIHLTAAERPRGEPPFIVYVDEFQNFVTDSIATILSEARKYGLGLVLAHQYLTQLPEELRDAVLGNVGTSVVFRVGAADAEILAPEFEPQFTAEDLVSIGPYETVVKLLARGRQLAPFSARTLPTSSPPRDAAERVATIREQSRQRYARPRREVETAIRLSFGQLS